ncbi:DDE superfamily endonuclease [Hirsutella rhossiliensis]
MSNNATQHKPQMAQIEEAMKSQSEGLRQTSSRLPSTHTEVPTVAFQTIIFGIMRQLFKEIEENSERARVFAQECSSTLSPRDLQAIAQFQGQLGSPNTLGGDPPYPVAENMEISRRNVLYEDGCFDREGTENAFVSCPRSNPDWELTRAATAFSSLSPHHRNTQNFDSPTSASLYLNQFTISSIAEMEARVQNALRYIENFPGAKVATVAREFGVTRDRLRYRLQGRPPKTGQRARNTRLSEPEEKALCRYIDRLDNINLAVRVEFVTDAANCILRERSSQRDAPTVGPNWTSRFLKRHGYFKKRQKRLQAERQVSENLTRVNQYFQHLRQVIQDNGIPPEDIWNMDETGFRIGVGKDQLIESATAIEAISANGEVVPAFLILAGQMHMASWYQIPELDPDTVIRPTPTGYSNDVISLEWLQHFDKHSEKSSRSSKRLLILDGHGSHHTRQFIEYCDNHNIIPFGMPPNLTHALQPLDVVVFQPLKHYHAKALDVMVRDGLVNITKLEFLSCIQQVRLHAFKESTIRSAFRKTGIFPFNPQVVLQCLEARQATTPTPPPNSGPHSSPFETPLTLRQINKVADKLDLVLEDDKSLDPDFSHDLSRFIRGSLSLATELAMKNIQLQSGGVLSVAQGREMVQQRGDDQIAKARKVVEDAEKKAHNARKRWFEEAAKKARQWSDSRSGSRNSGYSGGVGILEVGACEFQIKWGVARVLSIPRQTIEAHEDVRMRTCSYLRRRNAYPTVTCPNIREGCKGCAMPLEQFFQLFPPTLYDLLISHFSFSYTLTDILLGDAYFYHPFPLASQMSTLAVSDINPGDTRENKLARIRDNQKRSRARRREYVQDLKRRLREYETQGIEASTEVQMAARRVAEENKQLQELLNRHGISDDQITRFLQQPFHADDPSAAVQSLQRLLMPRQLASLDEDFSLYLSGQSIRNPSTTEGSTTSSSVWEPSQLVTSSYGYQHHMGVATAVMASAVHSPYPPTTPLSCVYGGQPHGNNTAYVYWRPYGNALALFCADLSKRSGPAGRIADSIGCFKYILKIGTGSPVREDLEKGFLASVAVTHQDFLTKYARVEPHTQELQQIISRLVASICPVYSCAFLLCRNSAPKRECLAIGLTLWPPFHQIMLILGWNTVRFCIYAPVIRLIPSLTSSASQLPSKSRDRLPNEGQGVDLRQDAHVGINSFKERVKLVNRWLHDVMAWSVASRRGFVGRKVGPRIVPGEAGAVSTRARAGVATRSVVSGKVCNGGGVGEVQDDDEAGFWPLDAPHIALDVQRGWEGEIDREGWVRREPRCPYRHNGKLGVMVGVVGYLQSSSQPLTTVTRALQYNRGSLQVREALHRQLCFISRLHYFQISLYYDGDNKTTEESQSGRGANLLELGPPGRLQPPLDVLMVYSTRTWTFKTDFRLAMVRSCIPSALANASITWKDMLDDHLEPYSGHSEIMAHVFKVEIESKHYALKVVSSGEELWNGMLCPFTQNAAHTVESSRRKTGDYCRIKLQFHATALFPLGGKDIRKLEDEWNLDFSVEQDNALETPIRPIYAIVEDLATCRATYEICDLYTRWGYLSVI